MNYTDLTNIVLRHDGAVFGGYVRDLLCGMEPSDLDVWFQTEAARDAFVMAVARVSKISVATREGEVDESYGVNRGFSKVAVTVWAEPANLTMELVVHADSPIGEYWDSHSQEPKTMADFDVNLLMLNRHGLSKVTRNFSTWESFIDMPLIEIVQRAVKKQMVEINTTGNRREKMLAKGFVEV